MTNPPCICDCPDPSGSLNGGGEVCLNCGGTLIEPEDLDYYEDDLLYGDVGDPE